MQVARLQQVSQRLLLGVDQRLLIAAPPPRDKERLVDVLAGSGEREAVVDQSKLLGVAIPTVIPGVPILLGDERVEERCGSRAVRHSRQRLVRKGQTELSGAERPRFALVCAQDTRRDDLSVRGAEP